MEDREKTHRDQRALILTLSASAAAAVLCAVYLLHIPSDTKNAFLFGLSKERLVMLAVFAVIFLLNIAGFFFRKQLLDKVFSNKISGWILSPLTAISAFFVLLPEYRFGRNAAYYSRLRPFILWIFLTSLIFGLCCRYLATGFSGSGELFRNLSKSKKAILGTFFVLIAGILFVEITGLGKNPEKSLWHKNGIPLQSIQLFVTLILFYMMYKLGFFSFLSRHKKIPHFLIIWLLSAVIWAQAPFLPHFFAPRPQEPNLEFYPYSDAVSYDLSAQTALNGWGFNFGQYFLKPTVGYIAFLSHLATGNNFEYSMLLQSAFYGILPAIIFVFGSSLGGIGCGYLAAVFSILKEWNALNTTEVSTVHSRLVMSEFLTQILLAAFCYAIYRWIKKDGRTSMYAAMAGGILTLGIYTRYNFAAFLPAALLLLLIAYRKNFRSFLKPLLLFSLAALMTAAPMIYRDSQTSSKGLFYYLNRTINKTLIAQRFNVDDELPEEEITETIPEKVDSGGNSQNASVQKTTENFPEKEKDDFNRSQITQFFTKLHSNKKFILFRSMIGHGLHNLISEMLTLPLQLTFDDLDHIYKDEGDGLWKDEWAGTFTARQWILICLWVLLGAAAIGCLIRQEGLAGFSIPYFWVVYAFSIGFSRSSGGRYIVPCNWIPGLLLAYLCVVLINRGNLIQIPEKTFSRKSSIFSTAGILLAFTGFFTSLLLFEKNMPFKTTAIPGGDLSVLRERLADRTDIDWNLVEEQVENKSMNVAHGVAVYPRFYYYRGGEHTPTGALAWKEYSRMTFVGINREFGQRKGYEYLMPHTDPIPVFPQDSVYRAISCKNTDGNYQDVLAVTVETPDGEVYTYVRDPLPEFSCPVAEPVCTGINVCQ